VLTGEPWLRTGADRFGDAATDGALIGLGRVSLLPAGTHCPYPPPLAELTRHCSSCATRGARVHIACRSPGRAPARARLLLAPSASHPSPDRPMYQGDAQDGS